MSASSNSLIKLRLGLLSILSILVIMTPSFYWILPVQADGLDSRSLLLASSSPGATTTYTITFTVSTTSTIGSLDILFCGNSPLSGDTCTTPAGLDVTHSVLTQSGITDFTSYVAAPNQLLLSRTPSLITAPLTVTLTFSNVINPSSIGPYYVRLASHASSDGTGATVDFGGLAYAIVNNLEISSVVPPYLTFCAALLIPNFDCSSASGNYIDFGELSSSHSSQGDSQLLVATNASNGYAIQVYGTTMTSGNNIIPAATNDSVSRPGDSQFGLNLRSNSVPVVGSDPTGPGTGQPATAYNDPNHYQYVDNDTIASSINADNYRKYTVSYVVNTSSDQSPGVYASTLTYVAIGSF